MQVGTRGVRQVEIYTVEDFLHLVIILEGFGNVNICLENRLFDLLLFYGKNSHGYEFFDCIFD